MPSYYATSLIVEIGGVQGQKVSDVVPQPHPPNIPSRDYVHVHV